MVLFWESESHRARSVVVRVDVDTHSVVRQKVVDAFRPFDKADCAAFEIVVNAYVFGFAFVLEAIEVEVVD